MFHQRTSSILTLQFIADEMNTRDGRDRQGLRIDWITGEEIETIGFIFGNDMGLDVQRLDLIRWFQGVLKD